MEKKDIERDLPQGNANFASDVPPVAIRRASPPPGYTQTSDNDVMTPGPTSQPPNYSPNSYGGPLQQPIYGGVQNGVPSQPPNYGCIPCLAPPQPNAGCVSETDRQYFIKSGQKSVVDAYILAVSPFGALGAHHFYLQRYYWGLLYFFTLGLMGCGYIADWFRIPCLVKQTNEKINNPGMKEQKTRVEAYILWFPFGLLGFHHYYLRNYGWGAVYTCTLGLGGVGWIVDAFRMCQLVRSANERQIGTDCEEKNMCLSIALTASPFGVLGAHHYYLNRPIWGITYTLTLGMAGLGWVFDWFRLPLLVKRANRDIRSGCPLNEKTVDDTYILWLVFGIIGAHHFYLGRHLWGILYFFTLGIGGLGWLIDVSRIPCLVKDANLKIQIEKERQSMVSRPAGSTQARPVLTTLRGSTNQGFTNYNMTNPAVLTPVNITWVTPSQGYNYQPEADTSQQQTCQKSSALNYPPADNTYYYSVDNEETSREQHQSTPGDIPPPPYQPSEPTHTGYHGDDPHKSKPDTK